MKIVICGNAGSGKSTTAKLIAKELGFKHYSMGDLQRKLAKDLGISIVELGHLEAKDPKYDYMIDDECKKIGREEDEFVIDGWLAAMCIPDGFKVFLDADIDERVRRRLLHKRKEESYNDPKVAKTKMITREEVNRKRWIAYYDFDYLDKKNYDLWLDTTSMEIGEAAKVVLEAIKRWKT